MMRAAGLTLAVSVLAVTVTIASTGCAHTLRAANPDVPVRLPRDHAAHADAQTEWWHFHGHMTDEQGRRYDWFLAFIKQHTDNDKLLFVPVRWFVDPFQLAYFVITDRSTGKYHIRELHAYPDVWAASASHKRMALRHNSWRAEMKDGVVQLSARTRKARANLRMKSLKPAALMGKNGYLHVPPRSSHYYYSIPRMAVDGTITIDGDERKVTGLGWLKHEWGFMYTSRFAGWVWFGLQLSSGHDVEIAMIFDKDWNMAKGSFAVVEEQDGTVTRIALRKMQVKQLGDVWRSPRTGTVYPTSWLIDIPGRGTLRVKAAVDAQEMVIFPANLWAGGMTVTGVFDGKRVSGDGFTEVVGLDKPFGRAFLRSGRPDKYQMVKPSEARQK